MGASKSKKKNGPKGKKSRAKAKLDQVWGEHVDAEARKASKVRIGKSRLLPAASKENDRLTTNDGDVDMGRSGGKYHEHGNGKKPSYDARADMGSSDDDDSDDELDEGMNGFGNGGSLASLLKRIRHHSDAGASAEKKVSAESDAEEAESSEDDDSSDNGRNHSSKSLESDESEDEMEVAENIQMAGKGIGDDVIPKVEDPYEAHFSKPPLPQLDSLPNGHPKSSSSKHLQLTPLVANIRKVNTKNLLSSSTEVQMSGPLLDLWDQSFNSVNDCVKYSKPDEKTTKSTNGKDASPQQIQYLWRALALAPYQHIKQVLTRNWTSVNNEALTQRAKKDGNKMTAEGNVFSPLQMVLYPAVSRYADVLLTMENRQNRDEISQLLSMHVLDHVLTSRTRVQRHNRRIKELTASSESQTANADNSTDLLDEGDDRWRDQGYTRPKVLVLFPTRGTCWIFVKQMIRLLGDAAMVDNMDRFDEEYGPPAMSEDGSDDEEEDTARVRRKAILKQKGPEWNELFGDDVNDDDDFKLGMSLTPNVVKSAGKKRRNVAGNADNGSGASGVSVKLFAEFYRSDIILSSPIGLKMVTTKKDDDDEDEETPTDVDFLSSIDICLVTRSDVLLMQNWDHVNGVLDCLNQQPKQISDIDFSRVRNYFLEGQGAHWRQLILVSSFADPHILSTFRRHSKNVEGQLKIKKKIPSDKASICDVMVRVKQVFQRVTCQSVTEVGSSRLRYFSDHVLPKLMRLKQKHTLIYIQSYFDFVAVRNLLLKREVDFVSVTEYARISEVSRGRARFLQGRKDIMLYTGRAHFFLRHKIKGARHLIFFGLPEYPEFYPAVVNMLNEGLSDKVQEEEDDVSRMPMSSLALYSKFDAHQLERIVGTSHCDRLVRGEKTSYMFC